MSVFGTATLAHLIFRNASGSFTPAGWYWVVLSSGTLVSAVLLIAFPGVVLKRVVWLQGFPHGVLVLRLFYAAVGAMAVWFDLMAVTSQPGQLV